MVAALGRWVGKIFLGSRPSCDICGKTVPHMHLGVRLKPENNTSDRMGLNMSCNLTRLPLTITLFSHAMQVCGPSLVNHLQKCNNNLHTQSQSSLLFSCIGCTATTDHFSHIQASHRSKSRAEACMANQAILSKPELLRIYSVSEADKS